MSTNPFDLDDRDFKAVVRALEGKGLKSAPDVRPDPPKPSVEDLDEQIRSIRESQMSPARVNSALARVQEVNKVAAERAGAVAEDARKRAAAERNRSARTQSGADAPPSAARRRKQEERPKKRRVRYNIKMVDAETGRVLRNVMGANAGDLTVSGSDVPRCYEMMGDTMSASVVGEAEAVAYMRFALPDDMVGPAKGAATDAVMAAPLSGDVYDMLVSAFGAAARAVRSAVSEACRLDMEDVEVSRGAERAKGAYGESVVSSFLYASSGPMPASEVVRKSVVRSLNRTGLVKQLSYPSLGRVTVCSATIYDTEVPSEVFKDVRHRGVACDIVYEKRRHEPGGAPGAGARHTKGR